MTHIYKILKKIDIEIEGRVKEEFKTDAFNTVREMLRELDSKWAMLSKTANDHFFENELVKLGMFDKLQIIITSDEEDNDFFLLAQKDSGEEAVIGPISGANFVPVFEALQTILEKVVELIDYLEPAD